LNLDSLPGLNEGSSSSSGGGSMGLEFLMNNQSHAQARATDSAAASSLLEEELNGLASLGEQGGFDSSSVRFDDLPSSTSHKSSRDRDRDPPPSRSSWAGGYGKFDSIPLNPDASYEAPSSRLSSEDVRREKFKVLRELAALKKRIKLTKDYTMESPLDEMIAERDCVRDALSKEQAIRAQSSFLKGCIGMLESFNTKYDPFDLELDGLSDALEENIEDYDDVFGELYDKYKSWMAVSPELKLAFKLGSNIAFVHVTNRALKSALPSM